jgi:S1 RNA binding domain
VGGSRYPFGPKLTVTCAVFDVVLNPDRATVWVPARSTRVRVPVTVPLAGGFKVTVIVQLAPPAKLEPHGFDSLKLLDPAEIVKAGDEITVKVLRVDEEKQKISLGLKQLSATPARGCKRCTK